MRKHGKEEEAALAALLAAGVRQVLSGQAQLAFGGATYTPTQVEAQLTQLATLRGDVDGARAVLDVKLAAEAVQAPPLRTFMGAFIGFVRATYGNSADVLSRFGLQPNKVRVPLTIEQKAAAAAKREATRVARHTMGSKQRQEIRGDVTGVVITPVVTSPPVGSSAPAPAPATAPQAASVAAAASAAARGA